MKLIRVILLLSAVFIVSSLMAQTTSLEYKVYRANEKSFHVASVLLSGKEEAVLVDAQFTLSDAHRVVADILESGKKLKAIYISHGDPDYYFGLSVITNAFPSATVYATEHTIQHIKETYQKKLDYWGAILQSNGPSNILLPQVLNENYLELEGEKLIIKGLEGKSPERTYLWIPSIRAIVGGVNVYSNLHLWMADAGSAEERKAWLEILDEMAALEPAVVIPAHALDNSALDAEAIAFSRAYLMAYEEALEGSANSAELIQEMRKLYPEAGLSVALEIGAKVSMGEMKW